MQAIRRLLIVALWVFVIFFVNYSWAEFKASAASYCALNGCTEQVLQIFVWIHVGVVVAAALVVHVAIFWIFADQKK